MTQEEKARAYDEALKKARFYHGNCPSEPERKKLEKMFPVLHESEDERIVNALISYFEWYERSNPTITGIPVTIDGFSVRDVLAYLEKQKEQKPAGCSEEDEKIYDDIMSALEKSLNANRCYFTSDDVNFLKLLRPSWKPSEEQMKALSEAVSTFDGYEESDAIKSLYNDLKKLM